MNWPFPSCLQPRGVGERGSTPSCESYRNVLPLKVELGLVLGGATGM